jgi:hypothetical protein
MSALIQGPAARELSEVAVTVLEARGLGRVFVHHGTPRDA